MSRERIAAGVAVGLLALLLLAGLLAPAHLADPTPALAWKGPLAALPFGTDQLGRPLWQYAMQGASILVGPAVAAGALVGGMGIIGGLVRCMESPRADTAVQAFSEVVGALPRMVVILIAALLLPLDWRGLLPLALVWALLSAPGAMDEAAAVAERLGGARFVEALRAHGFSWSRIFLYHIITLNLRPVLFRQATETVMHVTFLEVALSYLAQEEDQTSFTHAESVHSWASLLKMGYSSLVVDVPTAHALWLGLGLVGMVVVMAQAASLAARGR